MRNLDLTFGLFIVIWYDGENAYVSHFILMMDSDTNEMTEDSKNKLAKYLNGNGEILKTEFGGIVTSYEMTTDNIFDEYIKEGWACVKDRFFNMYFM